VEVGRIGGLLVKSFDGHVHSISRGLDLLESVHQKSCVAGARWICGHGECFEWTVKEGLKECLADVL